MQARFATCRCSQELEERRMLTGWPVDALLQTVYIPGQEVNGVVRGRVVGGDAHLSAGAQKDDSGLCRDGCTRQRST